VTACILALALYELGNKTVPIYDGAWAEWGSGPPEPALC
jgi:thiosulfate/3-mercaptopyruvate sulfurtransferase